MTFAAPLRNLTTIVSTDGMRRETSSNSTRIPIVIKNSTMASVNASHKQASGGGADAVIVVVNNILSNSMASGSAESQSKSN